LGMRSTSFGSVGTPSPPSSAIICAALCSMLLVGQPSQAYVYLQDDIVDAGVKLERVAGTLADSAYPVFKSLRRDTLGPLDASLANVVSRITPAERAELATLAGAAFPSAKTETLFSGASLDTCSPVPLPSMLIEALGAQASLQAVPPAARSEDSVCLPPPEKLAKVAATADSEKVNALRAQASSTWSAAAKKVGFQKMGELNSKLIGVMQGARLDERKALKAARQEYLVATQTVEELKRKQAEGPPKCYSYGCKTMFEAGLIVDDELYQKGMVTKRYPTNYGI